METEKYSIRVKGTWYFDVDVDASSPDEALDKARDEAIQAVLHSYGTPVELSFDNFDSWIE